MRFTRRELVEATLTLAMPTVEINLPQPSFHEDALVSYGPINDPKLPIYRWDNFVEGYRFVAPRVIPPPQKAEWIGPGESRSSGPVVLFRREFTLENPPKHAVASISGDITYRLWVNGKLAVRGPSDIGMDYNRTTTGKWFFDVRDFTHLLRAGRNVIAVEVFTERFTGWEGSRAPGHLLFELMDGNNLLLKSDSSWRSINSWHWLNVNGRWTYDGSREPHGWRNVSFEDAKWSSASEVENVWQPLVMSEVPARMERTYPFKGEFKRRSTGITTDDNRFPINFSHDAKITVRYERVLPAFISLIIEGGDGGTLYIEPNESDAPGFNRAAAIKLNGKRESIELPFLDSFSVINLRTEGITKPLVISHIRATFVSLPVDYRGEFHCSDSDLDELWEVCRWSTQICLQTHHLDSPHHQEPICDPGDYMILSLNNYAAFFQPALTRQDLRKYSWIMTQCKDQVFHTSYALLWLQMLMDYYDHTGDIAMIRELAPSVHSLLATFTGYRGSNGLISEAPNYMFMDWVDIAGFPGHHPPAVIGQGYMTAFYYRALADAARVAKLNREPNLEMEYNRLRSEVATSFQRELWSEPKGLYRDGKPFQTHVKPSQWLPADKEIETFTAHVNILAVLYDLAPKQNQAQIMERAVKGPDFTCQPYFMHFALEALAHCGLFEKLGVSQMKRWKIVQETRSLREMWNTGDLSHGWGATPLWQLTTKVLGVQVQSANHLIIAPTPCGLEYAKGVVPTQSGDVKVHWQLEIGELSMGVEIPKHCTAEVRLPGMVKTVGPGKHHFGKAWPKPRRL